jgi:ParB family transcriptional regulator, chromosome partitioning protein
MSSKQAKLMSSLGQNIAESSGAAPSSDRYTGFAPSETASGEMMLDCIMEDENQPRKHYDEQSLKDFAEHLKIHGIQTPIQLRWSEERNKWLIVYGHRRYRAARIAGFKTVPCSFASDDTDESTIRIRQLVENCQREDLGPMEMAVAIDALSKLTKWNSRRLGEELGMSHVSITRYRNLVQLPEEIQHQVRNGELAPSVAMDLLKIKDATKQKNMGRKIAQHKLNRQQARQHIVAEADPSVSGTVARPIARQKEILTQNNNIAVYRNPDVSDFQIQKELLAAAALLDPQKSET